MNGLEGHLLRAGYLHFIVSHQGCPDLLSDYAHLLKSRMVDGLIVVNTIFTGPFEVPVVTISGPMKTPGFTNIIVESWRELAISGCRSILSFACICMSNLWSPEIGYPAMSALLADTRDFTAVFCFNDLAAIGAIRALKDTGLSCPRNVSVIGFDDIATVAFHDPSLTTVRQPLKRMGEMAAQVLLNRIHTPGYEYPDTMFFQPELIVRESTGPVRAAMKSSLRMRLKRQPLS